MNWKPSPRTKLSMLGPEFVYKRLCAAFNVRTLNNQLWFGFQGRVLLCHSLTGNWETVFRREVMEGLPVLQSFSTNLTASGPKGQVLGIW